MSKVVSATDFKAKCLNLIDQMEDDGEPIVVTRRGKAVAMVTPVPAIDGKRGVIGAMKGSVRNFDDPFSPASLPDDWDVSR